MKVEITIGFALLLSGLYFFDDSGLFGATVLSIIIHELGHYFAIFTFGGKVSRLRLSCTGLSISYNEEDLSYGKELVVALAGPAASLVLAAAAALMGRQAGSVYLYYVSGTSLVYFAFNMIPVRQLDGGRALAMLFSLFWRTDTVERFMSVVSCAAILSLLHAGVMLLIVSGRNVSLLLTALFLFMDYLRQEGIVKWRKTI